MQKIDKNILRLRILERILKESYGMIVRPYGRNFKTVDNNPINYKSYPGIDVEEYTDNDGNFWVEIEVEKHPKLSARARSFPTASEAEMYARKTVDRIKIILANH